MLKRFLIIVSLIFVYSLLICVKEVKSASCDSCGDMSIQCMLSPGWNPGVAESDNEWYWFNCAGGSYNQLKVRATKGGDYSLCKIENQESGQCPLITDTCVSEGEDLYLYQGSGQIYWVLVHKNSGNPGFDIEIYCESGPPPTQTETTTPIIAPITYEDTTVSQEKISSQTTTVWAVVLIIIILAVIFFLYKYMKK